MSSLGDKSVRSPVFAVELRGRDAAAFVREVEAEAVKIVLKYAPKTKTLRSWDIRDSNNRLNRVFELNNLPYGPYPEGDSADSINFRGKQVTAFTEQVVAVALTSQFVSERRRLEGRIERLRTQHSKAVMNEEDVDDLAGLESLVTRTGGSAEAGAEGQTTLPRGTIEGPAVAAASAQ
ncbi:hypothetical protein ACJX0J_008095, partial [Zea mays]